jgi:glucose/mannose-6-phosphate isomerase
MQLDSYQRRDEILDSKRIFEFDPSGMMRVVDEWDQQIEEGLAFLEEPLKLDFDLDEDIDNIVVNGMGGSAIAGDIGWLALRGFVRKPFCVVRNYNLPLYTNPRTLVISISYSGNTEETLWGYMQAINHGAKTIAISSGGSLKELADWKGLLHIPVREGCIAPRAALGYLLCSFLKPFAYSNPNIKEALHNDLSDAFVELKRGKRKFNFFLEKEKNLAKRVASSFAENLPVIFAESEFTQPVARRWQTQINENGKALCHVASFPELDHNEIVPLVAGWEWSNRTTLLCLKDREEHPRNALRGELTNEMLAGKVREFFLIRSTGDYPLARALSLVQMGDYVSVYLALMRRHDPTRIEPVDDLKRKLALLK